MTYQYRCIATGTKPLQGAAFKRCGTEHWSKAVERSAAGKCKEAEFHRTDPWNVETATCQRKQRVLRPMRINCNRYKLFTGYRLAGIKAAGALHRVLYGTWENCPVDAPMSSREKSGKPWYRYNEYYKGHDRYLIMQKHRDAAGSFVRSHSSVETA